MALTRKRAGTMRDFLIGPTPPQNPPDQEWQVPRKTARPSKEAAKTPTTSHNRFERLPEVTGSKKSRVPPVIMEITGTHQQTIELIKSITSSSSFVLRYTGRGNVSITCASLELRATLMEGLKGRRAFHTFTSDDDKTVKSVLRGLPEIPSEEIAADITNQGLKVVKVTAMTSKAQQQQGGSKLYLVQFAAGTTAAAIRSIRYVCFTKAILERYRNNKSLTQCYRCQLYGHAAKNCQRAPRCVKCPENHATSDCPKKDRETPAKCTGCGGDHPANFSQCPRRMEYAEIAKKRQQRSSPVKQQKSPAATHTAPQRSFILEQDQFPALPTSTPAAASRSQPEESSPDAMSAADLRRMLIVLQEIRSKAGKCASKMEIALMLVEYLDVLF
jgi:hypothetical protein